MIEEMRAKPSSLTLPYTRGTDKTIHDSPENYLVPIDPRYKPCQE